MRFVTSTLSLAAALAIASPALAQDSSSQATTAEAPATPDWVATSNAYTTQMIAFDASFYPEGASSAGYEDYDGLAMDLSPDSDARYLAGAAALKTEFEAALKTETDGNVQQDLQILIDSLDQSMESRRLGNALTLQWTNVPQIMFGNLSNLLDEQIVPGRRAKAIELLRRYTGLHDDTTPLVDLAKARFEASRGEGKVGPYIVDVKESVDRFATFSAGIRELFERFEIEGADEALAAMDKQIADYGAWTTRTVVPAARTDARLPEELYALRLRSVGIDIDPREAMSRARRGYYELRAQMHALAPSTPSLSRSFAQKISSRCRNSSC